MNDPQRWPPYPGESIIKSLPVVAPLLALSVQPFVQEPRKLSPGQEVVRKAKVIGLSTALWLEHQVDCDFVDHVLSQDLLAAGAALCILCGLSISWVSFLFVVSGIR